MGRNSMTCEDAEKFVHVYLDGEFSEEDRLAFEAHLADCESCRKMVRFEERFKQALRTKLVHPAVPAGLSERISEALDAAEDHAGTRSAVATWALRLAPVAVAAGVAAAVVVIMEPSRRRGGDKVTVQQQGPAASRSIRPMVAQARVPEGLTAPSMDRIGSSAAPVRTAGYVTNAGYGRQAASARPMVRVRVVDPRRIPPDGFVGRWVAGRKVYFGMQAGLNVAMFEDNGLGYALSADLPEEELAEIVRTFLDR